MFQWVPCIQRYQVSDAVRHPAVYAAAAAVYMGGICCFSVKLPAVLHGWYQTF